MVECPSCPPVMQYWPACQPDHGIEGPHVPVQLGSHYSPSNEISSVISERMITAPPWPAINAAGGSRANLNFSDVENHQCPNDQYAHASPLPTVTGPNPTPSVETPIEFGSSNPFFQRADSQEPSMQNNHGIAEDSLPITKIAFGAWKCAVCGKELRRRQRAIAHYWNKHGDMKINCQGQCGSIGW